MRRVQTKIKNVEFTNSDIQQIESKGLSIDKVQRQITIFENEIPFMVLHNPAVPGHGINTFSDSQKKELSSIYEKESATLDVLKFVPASGAATRMFKDLFKFLEQYDFDKETLNSYTNHENATAIRLFLIGLTKFPFYTQVMEAVHERYADFENLSEGRQLLSFVDTMLREKGLNYGSYPKGLFPFHNYGDEITTAFGEHLYEAAGYVAVNGVAKVHFTVSKEHLDAFKDEFERIKQKVARKTDTQFEITFSFQKQETDTIAVTPDNQPYRLDDDSILFRPGGHGALIENLNDLDADIIFVKNIDNVVVRKYQEELAENKKIVAGKLLQVQKETFRILELIAKEIPSKEEMDCIKDFLLNDLNIELPLHYDKFAENYQIEFLREVLDRPIRVCGMVKNEGEPGGGPFWVKQENGRSVLQIVETAQINRNDRRQNAILGKSTHFNPVDLVCAVRNYRGEKFNLLNFVDPDAGFITSKTKDGKALKALELPGLWNGAMADWISIFVEVPLTTFNPVKTVNDLLKSAHQVKIFS